MIGRTLSHFKITAKLGEGGMGEVYRAEDSKLGRDVAIKVLPAGFTQDPERLARFEREAKVLASLNHQNIAAIHQVEQVDDTYFLVMELVEGETLAEHLDRGAFSVDEGLPIALQIAEALEAAHEKGIIHRDLKPANVKITPEGRVKVLDFGLAKAWEPEDDKSGTLSMSPTLTAQMTQTGVILGTAAYMAPEQAKGKHLDRRADIWAYGVVLWEILVGKRLFSGDSVSEILAAVLMSEPDLKALPAQTPASIRRLLERCLRKDPLSRLRDMGDARIVLEETLAGHQWAVGGDMATPERVQPRVARSVLLVAMGLALGIGLTFLWPGRAAVAPAQVTNVAIPIGPTLRVSSTVANGGMPLMAHDGRTVVFSAIDVNPEATDHRPSIYLRRLEDNRLSKMNGSAGSIAHALSPDGRWLAFVVPSSQRDSRYQIMKVPVDGSASPLKIADWPDGMRKSLVWATEATLFGFRTRAGAILPFSADGSPPGTAIEMRSELNAHWVEGHSALPGGRHILVYYASFDSGAYRQDVGLLDSATGEYRHLIDDASRPWYAKSGHIMFTRRGALLAVPFDIDSLQVTGGAQSVLDGLWSEGLWTGGLFSISAEGHLLYGAGRVQGMSRYLAILSRDGEATRWSDDHLYFDKIWGSPDGRRLAVQVDNVGEGDALLQIRVSDLDRPRLVTVGAVPGKDCGWATWSTDSRSIAFLCWDQEVTTLYSTPVDGRSPHRVLLEEPAPVNLQFAGFSAADSSIFLRREDAEGVVQLISVPFDRATESHPTARRVAMTEADWSNPSISPDGRWLLYIASEAGRREVFVREVLGDTEVGPRILASSEIGDWVRWSKSTSGGRYELLLERAGKHFSLAMATAPTVQIADPQELKYDPFSLGIRWLDSLPDGRLLIVRAPDTELGAPELRLVLNWTQRLTQQVSVSVR